jgi:hypothetical protein
VVTTAADGGRRRGGGGLASVQTLSQRPRAATLAARAAATTFVSTGRKRARSRVLTRLAQEVAQRRKRCADLTDVFPTDIRIQQRNGRKTLTTVQGLPNDLDFQRILKAFKKVRLRAELLRIRAPVPMFCIRPLLYCCGRRNCRCGAERERVSVR